MVQLSTLVLKQTLYMPHFIAILQIQHFLQTVSGNPVSSNSKWHHFFQQHLLTFCLPSHSDNSCNIQTSIIIVFATVISDVSIVTVWDACIWPQTSCMVFCSTDWLFLSSALSSGFLILIHNSIEIRPVKNPTMASKRLTERMS